MTLPSPELDRILTAWALRFDGYKYVESPGYDPVAAIDRWRAAGNWGHLHPALQLTLFFHIQRGIYKWGSVYRDEEVEWRAFLSLFLTTCRYAIAADDRKHEWYESWEADCAPHIEEHIRLVLLAQRALGDPTVHWPPEEPGIHSWPAIAGRHPPQSPKERMSNPVSTPRPTELAAYVMLGGQGKYQKTIEALLKHVRATARLTRGELDEFAQKYRVKDERLNETAVKNSMDSLRKLGLVDESTGVVVLAPQGAEYLHLAGAERDRFLAERILQTYILAPEVLHEFTNDKTLKADEVFHILQGKSTWVTKRQVEIRIGWLREAGCLRKLDPGEHRITTLGKTMAAAFPPEGN